jgi:hypothetical protein
MGRKTLPFLQLHMQPGRGMQRTIPEFQGRQKGVMNPSFPACQKGL